MGVFFRSNYNNLKKALKMYRKQVLSLQVLLKSINKFWGKRKKTNKEQMLLFDLGSSQDKVTVVWLVSDAY